MFSEGILIYFYTDRFGSVNYINTVSKSFLVRYLRRSFSGSLLHENKIIAQCNRLVPGSFLARTTSQAITTKFEEETIRLKN